jgi:DNA-binding CsgD family transcriptional regulator
MNINDTVKVAIAENILVIRTGLSAVLKRLPTLRALTLEVTSEGALNDCIRMQHPDILIVNPCFGFFFDIDSFRAKHPGSDIRIAALVGGGFIEPALLAKYDTVISVFDSIETISDKLTALLTHEEEEQPNDDGQEALSQREKEIVSCVVKGLTNKEIAEQLFLSVHTVITHRKNISKKLQIHSVSGLTIYAIVNKLVELSDIKQN